jgi:sugar phosphate isomerase/epimerase
MQVKYFISVWGWVDSPADYDQYDQKLAQAKAAGYDGIEAGPPEIDPAAWTELLDKHGLLYLGMIFPFTGEAFREQYDAILPYRPMMLCVHSGRDRMSFEDGCKYLDTALKVEADGDIPVAHELHRGRMFCNPWQTVPYVERFENLKFCADFSHFVNVCESLLDDHVGDLIEPIIQRSIHIHGRVGHEEGPQVPDPRAPEWLKYVEVHEAWWDRIHAARKADGAKVLPFDPEFGGDPYLPRLPYTKTPMVDLWDVRLWMMNRTKQRWG